MNIYIYMDTLYIYAYSTYIVVKHLATWGDLFILMSRVPLEFSQAMSQLIKEGKGHTAANMQPEKKRRGRDLGRNCCL